MKNILLAIIFTFIALMLAVGNQAQTIPVDEGPVEETRPPLITSVSVIDSPAKAGDDIIIRVTGKTGAKVLADIDQVAYDLPLIEITEMPGVYEGKHTVVEGEDVSDSVVTVHFTSEGETITDKSQRVTIDTIAPAIKKIHVDESPLQNGLSFTLTVNCEVGAIVTVDLSQLDTTRGIAVVPEVADGIFSKDFTISYDNAAFDGMKTIVITARDAAGNQSTEKLLVELENPTLNTQQLEIFGQVIVPDNTLSGDARVSVYNATSKREKISPIAADGNYTVVFSDSKNPVAEIGTNIYVSVLDGKKIIANVSHRLSPAEVTASKTTIDVEITDRPKIDITVEPSVLPADGYSIAMVTVTVADAPDAKVEISASSRKADKYGTAAGIVAEIAAPLVNKEGSGVWTTTYTAGKTPGNILLTASIRALSSTLLIAAKTVEVLLKPPDAVSESILIHSPLKRVIVGKTVLISGMIDPPLFAETINLEVSEPDGISWRVQSKTTPDGQFYFHIKLNKPGTWKFRANHKKIKSSIAKIYVEAEPYVSHRGKEWKPSLRVPNKINYLLEDTHGVLWVATDDGVMKLERGAIASQAFRDEEWIMFGLGSQHVHFLLEDSYSALWAAAEGSVHKLLLEDGKWEEYSQGIGSQTVVNSLFEDSYGVLWAATSNGVMKLERGTIASQAFRDEEWIFSGLDNEYVNFFLEDSHGTLLAATNHGVSWLDGETWRQDGYGLGSKVTVKYLLEDTDGVLWAATYSGVWKLTDGMPQPYTDGLVSKNVNYLLEDNHGILWAATNENVYWLNEGKWEKYGYGLGSVIVTSLLEDSYGVLWAATNSGVWKLMSEMWKQYTIRDGLENDFVNYLLEDSYSGLWAVTNGGGVSKLENGTWRTYSEGLGSESVNCLLESRGTLWAATNEGVSRLDGEMWRPYGEGLEGKFVNYLLESQGSLFAATNSGVSKLEDGTWRPYGEELEGKSVNCLLESQGTLWAATNDGVSKLEDGTWKAYSEGLKSKFVNCLLEDSQLTLWAGTNGGGVSKLEDGTWNAYSEGLASKSVNYLLEYSRGILWAATNWGVSRFNPNQERWYADDRLEYNCNHIIEDRHGTLWFATSVGVIRYEPNSRAPQTKIKDGPGGVIGEKSTKFEYDGSDIETDSRFLLYSHRLDNDRWSAFSEEKFADIPADDGIHTFYVRAMDADGNVDPTPAKRTFRIDTTKPIAIIEKPSINDVIGGEYLITGTATDATDFLEYEIKIYSHKTGVDNILRIGQHQVSAGTLATWDTKGKNGIYTITLTVRDKKESKSDTQHEITTSVTVAVDNTPPTAVSLSVTDSTSGDDELSADIQILGEIKDDHIAGYKVEWIQHGREGVIKEADKFDLEPITIDFDSSAIYGQATIRLTARDLAGNTSQPAKIDVFFNNGGPRPTARLEVPTENDVIAGTYEIKGEAKSVGIFKSYAVQYAFGRLLREATKGENPSADDWIDIGEGSNPSEERLAIWDTTKLPDGQYSIKLTVTDEYDYDSDDIVHIVIDNAKPVIELTSPEEGSIETGEVTIIGEVTDDNFNNYKFEFAPGANPSTGWEQLGEITESKMIERTWRTEGLDGLYSIRITATDKAIPNPNQEILVRTITLDNTVAEAKITSPESGKVYKEIIEIRGTANDDNFSDYQLFWGKGEKPSKWNSITDRKTIPVTNGLLSSWDTARRDGVYQIKLIAHDKSQHKAEPEPVTIIVDNTDPTAKIDSPRDNEQVGDHVTIRGTATDDNFKEYIIEYGEGAHPTIWTEASENAHRERDVIEGQLFEWLPGDKTGFIFFRENNTMNYPLRPTTGASLVLRRKNKSFIFTLRLTVKDEVNHTSQAKVTVNVLPAINDKSGGETKSADRNASIYVPPNSLSDKKVITINPVPEADIKMDTVPPDVTYLGIAYDFEPNNLKFKSKPAKPALITISYADAPIQPHPNKTVKLYRQNEHERWTPIGGTVDVKKRKISVAVMELGRYAIMEADIENGVEPSIHNLTCQPRVFGVDVYHSSTAISFELGGRATVTVNIYNLAGRLRKTLVDNETMSPGRNVVTWDGTDEGGETVLSGLYVIVVLTEEDKVTTTVAVLNR